MGRPDNLPFDVDNLYEFSFDVLIYGEYCSGLYYSQKSFLNREVACLVLVLLLLVSVYHSGGLPQLIQYM